MNTRLAVPTREQFAEVLRTGAPIFAELFLISLFVMADTALLKPCGTVAIASVGLTGEPINLIEFAFFALQTAVIAIMARTKAKGEHDKLGTLICGYLKLVFAAVLGVSLLTAVFARPYLSLFGGDAEMLPIAIPYFRVSLMAVILRRLSGAMTDILKALGHPQWSFILNLSANAVNIVFDILLINGYGPFPRMGAVGAAAATVIGCAVGFVGACAILFGKLRESGVDCSSAVWRRSSRNEVRTICTEAAPLLGEKIMIRLGVFLSISKVATLGTTAFAAYRILISLQNFAYLGAEAFATTTLIFLSRAYAMQDEKKARSYFTATLVCALSFASVCLLAFLVLGTPLMSIYSDDPAVIGSGAAVLRFICFYQPFQAAALLLASGMRSVKRASIPSVVTTIGIVVIRPALVYLLTGTFGVAGAWMAIMTDEIFRFVVLFVLQGKMWREFADRTHDSTLRKGEIL